MPIADSDRRQSYRGAFWVLTHMMRGFGTDETREMTHPERIAHFSMFQILN